MNGDFEKDDRIKLYDSEIYWGMLYGMYCNLNKDYEKTYWDLLMCWLYDFKYRYNFCDLSSCPDVQNCFDSLLPVCCFNNYHYLGEYKRFFCAEMACLTLILIFQFKEALKHTNQFKSIGYDECINDLDSIHAKAAYYDRTVVSIEYLLDPKTFSTYHIGELIIYDKIYCA